MEDPTRRQYEVGIAIILVWVILLLAAIVGVAQAEERASYTYPYEVVVPYLAVSEPGNEWFNGIAVTNHTKESVWVQVWVVDGHRNIEFTLLAGEVETLLLEVDSPSYARVRSTGPVKVTVLIGNGMMLQGGYFDLMPIAPAEPGTPVEVTN